MDIKTEMSEHDPDKEYPRNPQRDSEDLDFT